MASSTTATTAISATKHRSGTGREALIEAAKRLLPDRAPGAIAGRDLAEEADVNYGLVHHYFGGKDQALRAGLRALRDDFVTAHGDITSMPLLTTSDPYFKALVRWHLHDSARVAAHSYSASLTAAGQDRLELDGYGAAGMSGSPLFSAEGKVVGVVYGGSRNSGGGLLFAVPVRQVRELLGDP